MSERDELERLAGAWRGITDDATLSVPAALGRQRRQKALFALELAGCGLLLLVAVLYWLASDGLVFRVTAVVFVAVAVLAAVIAVKMRVALSNWANWTPEGVLVFRVRECDVALLNVKYGLFSAAVLVAFAAFVWIAAELEWDALPPGFHLFYAGIVTVAVIITITWSVWRVRTKRRERAQLQALLEELKNG